MILGKAMEYIKLAFGGAYADNVKEVKQHRIYDTRYFKNGNADDATFFTIPVGGAWRNGQKTLNETNMRVSGQLPSGEDMVLTHLSVKLIVPNDPDDQTDGDNQVAQWARAFQQILQSSYFEFKVKNKSYESQLHGTCFMPKPLYITAPMTANGEDSTVIGRILGYGWWDLYPVPIPLGAQENFYCTHYVGNPDATIATELDAASTVLYNDDATMVFTARGLSIHKK